MANKRNGSTLSQSKKSGVVEAREHDEVANAYELNALAPVTEPSERAYHVKQNHSVDHMSQGRDSALSVPSLLKPAELDENSPMRGPGFLNHSARNTG